ncbi:MAG: hypothetical protein JXB07_11960 [Anaerolineae bacterium]|nr:hypothetical protein [Anaerolineae bacterium]
MTDNVQRAIDLIKSGDKQGGQRILAQVLKTDPQNELAWLWMSTVVDRDKRRYCLEKTLSINPDNVQAKQALELLSQKEASSSLSQVVPEVQSSASLDAHELAVEGGFSAGASRSEMADADVWVKRTKYYVYVSILTRDEVIVGRAGANRTREIQSRVEQKLPVLELFGHTDTVRLAAVSKVILSLGTINVEYSDEKGDTRRLYVPCPDDEATEAAMDAFQRRLGSRFERTQAPLRTCMALGIPTFMILGVIGGTVLFFFLAQEAMTTAISGSWRARALGMILRFLGPNGVLCIGGVLLVFFVAILIRWGLNPPLDTILAPRGQAIEMGSNN